MLSLDQLILINHAESGTIDLDAHDYYELMSNQGSAKFTYELADLLISRGYESDYREAARLLKSVADEMPKAAARLGRLYMDGRGVPEKDYKTAFNWLKKAKEAKNPMGMTYFGILHQDGLYKDPKLTKTEVFSLFEAAAKQGNLPEATYRVGLSHITGYGTKMDMGQGVQYIKLAAQNRNLRALYQLAQLNSEG